MFSQRILNFNLCSVYYAMANETELKQKHQLWNIYAECGNGRIYSERTLKKGGKEEWTGKGRKKSQKTNGKWTKKAKSFEYNFNCVVKVNKQYDPTIYHIAEMKLNDLKSMWDYVP